MLSGPEEARLARAAAGGDGHAFACLYDAYEQRIHTYCRRLLGSEHDADDATQEAFLGVLRRLPELDREELDFGAYLFTAARNCCYEMIRKRKRAEPVDELPDEGEQPIGRGPAIDSDPARAAMLADQRRSVRAANARLPDRQREVLVLREVEEMSYEQIGSLMAMNANSVAQLLSRARIRLRQELRGEEAGAIAAASTECEAAIPLLSRRLDGDLDDADESRRLEQHLAGCESCRLAEEAMQEAGRSYRAWAPILPAAYLFRDTIAKASELTGSDWSSVERPSTRGGDLGARFGIGAGAMTVVVGLILIFGATASDEDSLSPTGEAERPAAAEADADPAMAERLRVRKANRLQARRAARRRAAAASEDGAAPGAEAAPAPVSATQPPSTPVSGPGAGAGDGGETGDGESGEAARPRPDPGPTARPPVWPGTPPAQPKPSPPAPTTPPDTGADPKSPPDDPEPSEPDDPPNEATDPPPTGSPDYPPRDDDEDEATGPDGGPPAGAGDDEERIEQADGTD